MRDIDSSRAGHRPAIVRGAERADTLGMTDTLDPPIGLDVVVRERWISIRTVGIRGIARVT